MKRFVLKYGFISGAILAVFMVVGLRFVDDIGDKGEVFGYSTMVVSFLMVYFGVRAYRDSELGGNIGFGRALKTALLISLISCACYVATWETIYYGGMAPNFDKKFIEKAMQQAKVSGASPEQLAKTQKEQEKFWAMYKNPLVNVAFTFLEPLPVALLISLVTAGVLSRKRKA